MYSGIWPCKALYVKNKILKLILKEFGNKSKEAKNCHDDEFMPFDATDHCTIFPYLLLIFLIECNLSSSQVP